MEHFSSDKWADFVRNVLEQKQKAMMQVHLDAGCESCSKALAAWVHVRNVAAREREHEPPARAVRLVKGLLAIHGKPRREGVAALLFDSLLTPGVVGVRSAAGAARQLLYAQENYRIDLRLEKKVDSNAISLVGQILISEDPAVPVAQAAVALLRDRKIVSTSRTNEFGEFHLECGMASSLRLQFVLPDRSIIRTAMIKLSGGAAIDLEDPDSNGGTDRPPAGS